MCERGGVARLGWAGLAEWMSSGRTCCRRKPSVWECPTRYAYCCSRRSDGGRSRRWHSMLILSEAGGALVEPHSEALASEALALHSAVRMAASAASGSSAAASKAFARTPG